MMDGASRGRKTRGRSTVDVPREYDINSLVVLVLALAEPESAWLSTLPPPLN